MAKLKLDKRIQHLINTGLAWTLEGSTGRACMRAIEEGRAVLGVKPNNDAYGNRVPSRYEVKAGTKGSLQYAQEMQRAGNF